jgi:hypothetical protein
LITDEQITTYPTPKKEAFEKRPGIGCPFLVPEEFIWIV